MMTGLALDAPLFRDKFHPQLADLKAQALKRLCEILQYDYQLQPVMAAELEFYIPQTGPYETAESLPAILNRALAEAKLPAQPVERERGPQQYEIALDPTADIAALANDLWRLPDVICHALEPRKAVADFRAKPEDAQYGSGLHLHLHLQDKHGVNLFTRGKEGHYSRELLWTINGMLELLPETMLFFAPEAASYSRFLGKRQNAPTHICWGPNNRTTALRLPNKSLDNKHIEHRVAGADADPQLAMIAVLAGACHGFALRQFPIEAIHGNASDPQYGLDPLPTYKEALLALQESDALPQLLGKQCYSELLRRFLLPTAF
jgi:glutamine synthetase